MRKSRKIDDIEAYWVSVRPILKATRIQIRNSQKRRPISNKTKSIEEINVLVNCAKKRFSRWQNEGVLIKISNRKWELNI